MAESQKQGPDGLLQGSQLLGCLTCASAISMSGHHRCTIWPHDLTVLHLDHGFEASHVGRDVGRDAAQARL